MIDGGLRRIFHARLPHIHWQAMETGMTGGGVPDSNGCYDRKEFWVEYKKTNGWTVPLRPAQIGWHLRRQRAGGRTFIAVRRKDAELWLFNGGHAKLLKIQGLKGSTPLGHWNGGPERWDWEKIEWWLIS